MTKRNNAKDDAQQKNGFGALRKRLAAELNGSGEAPTPKTTATLQRSEELGNERALQRCKALAKEPNILDAAYAALVKHGLVGEKRNSKLLYLILTSRILKKPVSAVIKAEASAGKSHLVEKVTYLFPRGAYFDVTSMSDKALVYSDEDFRHRMIILYEAAGLSPTMEYFLRTLLSEGRIRHSTIIRGQPVTLEKKGPAGLVTTTTKLNLHPENESRVLSLAADDTEEQTSAIMHVQMGSKRSLAKDERDLWRALQTWVSEHPKTVRIPFGQCIADLIPPVSIRLRRDVSIVRALIEAHALLHQKSRTIDSKGRVIAEFEDYRIVRTLIHDLVAEGTRATVSTKIRDTYRAVSLLQRKQGHSSLGSLAKQLGIDPSSASRRVSSAIELGYIKNLTKKSGVHAQLVTAAPLPDDVVVLPSVKSVNRLFKKRSSNAN